MHIIDIDQLQHGQTVLVEGLFPYYVVVQSDEMLRDLTRLTPHVWNERMAAEYTDKNGRKYFIFYGISTAKPGCAVRYIPKLIPHPYRPREAVWLGGFYDGCRDVSFDYAGRAIRDHGYTFVNFTRPVKNLYEVKDVRDDGERISIYPLKLEYISPLLDSLQPAQ